MTETKTFAPPDIIWFKSITDITNGAYLDLNPDSTFMLIYPTKHKGNVLKAEIGEIILLHQKINGVPCFTHLVTPTDNTLHENSNPYFKYGRQVSIIAMADKTNPIPVAFTKWAKLRYAGIVQGNACKVSNIKNIENISELQLDIWNRLGK